MLVEKTDAYAGEEIILINGVYILRAGNRTAKFILIVQKPAYPIKDRLAFVCIVNVGSVDC